MNAPTKRNAGRAPGGFVKAEEQSKPSANERAHQSHPQIAEVRPRSGRDLPLPEGSRPFSVVVAAGRRLGLWGRYSSLGQADAVATRLLQRGMAAIIEEDHVPRVVS